MENNKEDYVIKLSNGSKTNISEILREIRGAYRNSNIERIKQLISKLEEFKGYADIEKLVDDLIDYVSIFGLNDGFYSRIQQLIGYLSKEEDEGVPIINQAYKEIYNNQKDINGISFLVDDIDKLTGGLMPGTVATIAGGPGCMKTTYAVNICYRAVKQGKNVCYLSLEETPYNLYSKLLSRVSSSLGHKIPHADIIKHTLGEKEEKLLFDEVQPYLESLKGVFRIVGEENIKGTSYVDIEALLKEVNNSIKEESKCRENSDSNSIDLIVVDHLQMLKYWGNGADEKQVMNSYVSFFRRLSKDFLGTGKPISVIFLSQVNREGIKYARRKNGEYLMDQIAEASELERSSSYIITTYTDSDVQLTKQLKIGAVKLRGSQLPVSTLTIYVDGTTYQVGDDDVSNLLNYSAKDVLNFDNESNDYQIDNTNLGLLDFDTLL